MLRRTLDTSLIVVALLSVGCTLVTDFEKTRSEAKGGAGGGVDTGGRSSSGGTESKATYGGGSGTGSGGASSTGTSSGGATAGTTAGGSSGGLTTGTTTGVTAGMGSQSATPQGGQLTGGGTAGVSASGGAPAGNGGATVQGGVAGAGVASTLGGTTTGGTTATGGGTAAGAATGGASTGGAVTAGGPATGGTATGGVATGGASTGGVSFGGCPDTGGPSSVRTPKGYCIDSTEVTRLQYSTWLGKATQTDLDNQDGDLCSWNASFAPNTTCAALAEVCKGTYCDDHPQVCIDWCDAVAYCKANGKRLCGKIGGGEVELPQYANETMSQWYDACTSGGKLNYPYASTFNPEACIGTAYWDNPTIYSTTLPVKTLVSCSAETTSVYAGIYDLSGNVAEWEDSCAPIDQGAPCPVRGGHFRSLEDELACNAQALQARNLPSSTTGFRCCSQ